MLFKMTEPQLQAEPGARARARRALHPARRPRAELQHQRDARHRQLARRSVFVAGRRGGGALRAAARRRQRSRAADARRRSARSSNVPAFIKRVKARRRPADGLRPPRLQVVRPARARSSSGSPTWCSRSPARTRCSTSRSSSSGSRWRTTTSSARKLYPNVDFYSGLIYQAMGFPVEMFPVLFAIPRTAGWIAQWEEMLLDPEQKIARPRQIYIGPAQRDYVVAGQARRSRDRSGGATDSSDARHTDRPAADLRAPSAPPSPCARQSATARSAQRTAPSACRSARRPSRARRASASLRRPAAGGIRDPRDPRLHHGTARRVGLTSRSRRSTATTPVGTST